MDLKNSFKTFLNFVSLMLLLNIAFEILEQKLIVSIIIGGMIYALVTGFVEYKKKEKKDDDEKHKNP